ncbi:MAG: TetR/AcrR family transcriptional regulator [Rubrivivax sp.]
MAEKKKPRRTAERILEVTLELYNRFGEPNVSTTLISAELGISPGNLYYHYPAKEELTNRLFDRYERAADELLDAASAARHVEDAWLFFQLLFELIWRYRFLYRDLNDLLSRNRRLETNFQRMLARMVAAVQTLLAGLERGGIVSLTPPQRQMVATAMVVLLSYWLSFEYVRDPRRALEPEHAGAALARGAYHTLGLLAPWLEPDSRRHLQALVGSYADPAEEAAGRAAPSPSRTPDRL